MTRLLTIVKIENAFVMSERGNDNDVVLEWAASDIKQLLKHVKKAAEGLESESTRLEELKDKLQEKADMVLDKLPEPDDEEL